jgi:hypothetical protein
LHLIANVTEPGDIALYVTAVVGILVVGLVLLGIDTVVERLGRRRGINAATGDSTHQEDRPPRG